MKYGVIDCGTNTFNLLVVQIDDQGHTSTLFKNKIPVKLAPSPTTGVIGKNRFSRAIDALFVQKNILINLGVNDYKVVATSAIREAGNGCDLVDVAKKHLHMHIEVLSGEEEASLICRGVVAL